MGKEQRGVENKVDMRRRTLTVRERDLLKACLTKHNPQLLQEMAKLESGEVVAQAINEMREAITDELIEKGLAPDDEPNEYGLTLEDLNERLAKLYLWPNEARN